MDNQKHAGFWIRFGALIIDGIILGVVVSVIASILGIERTTTVNGASAMNNGYSGLSTLIGWIYFTAMTVTRGATVGKMALGLKVVKEDGKAVDWGTGVLREVVGKFVSAVVFGLGFLWVAFDPKKQGWHDKIAKTFVVKK